MANSAALFTSPKPFSLQQTVLLHRQQRRKGCAFGIASTKRYHPPNEEYCREFRSTFIQSYKTKMHVYENPLMTGFPRKARTTHRSQISASYLVCSRKSHKRIADPSFSAFRIPS